MECPSCKTIIQAGQAGCPACGLCFVAGAQVDPLIGVVVDGRYELLEKIGSGGMGSVYRANQLAMGRQVAVKVVNALALQDPATVRRFETEARIISQLEHPNTLKLIDFGTLPDERPYLVTEFLRGHALADVLAEGPMPPQRTLEIIYEICDALSEAHKHSIIHRDLKPENIFLEEVGGTTVVRVLDFGIAKFGQTSNTATGTVCGTPAYMSPEQAQGGNADARSDIYALGILAYRCMVGHPPFMGEQPLAILLKQIQEAPVPLRDAMGRPDLATEVEWLIMAMLEKVPDQRPASAAEVQSHIEYILSQVTFSGAPLAPVVTPEATYAMNPAEATPLPAHFVADPRGGHDPHMMRVMGVGLLGLALSIAAAAFMWKNDGDRIPVVEAVTVSQAAAVEASLPIADVPPLEEAPEDIIEDTRRPASEPTVDKSKRHRKKRSAASKKKSKKSKSADIEPPPGFLDFDVN